MSTLLRSALPLLAAAWLAAPVQAGVKTHVVSAGESVSSIAKHYYGDHDRADLLLRFNGKPTAVIHPGERLRIPYCEVHRVKLGDTWSTLAERYAGRASAYPAIALLNRLSPDEPLRVDQPIVMPVAVPYRLERGDTLASLAERFYAERGLARPLQIFNEIEDPQRLSVGQAIEVPLTTLRLDATRASASRAKVAPGTGPAKATARPPEATADRQSRTVERSGTGPAGTESPDTAARGPARPEEKRDVPTTSRQAGDAAAVRPPSPAPAARGARASAPSADGPAVQESPLAPARPATAAAEPAAAASIPGSPPTVSRPPAEPVAGDQAPEPAPPPPSRFQGAIDRAFEAFHRGAYDRAQELIHGLRGPVLAEGTAAERGELLRAQAFLAVAFDRPGQACAAYRALGELSPPVTLDPKQVSPRIREVLERCARTP